jgi:L-lactate utilization protein LutC
MADKQQLILENSMLKQRVHELQQLYHKTLTELEQKIEQIAELEHKIEQVKTECQQDYSDYIDKELNEILRNKHNI